MLKGFNGYPFFLYLVCLSIDAPVDPTSSLQVPVPYLFLASGVQSPSNLQTSRVTKRSVTYSFTASPTSGATYKVTFTPQRASIPQPQTEMFNNARSRIKSGLISDVTYRLQVVAVLNGVESSAISKDFTTLPDGKTTVKTKTLNGLVIKALRTPLQWLCSAIAR